MPGGAVFNNATWAMILKNWFLRSFVMYFQAWHPRLVGCIQLWFSHVQNVCLIFEQQCATYQFTGNRIKADHHRLLCFWARFYIRPGLLRNFVVVVFRRRVVAHLGPISRKFPGISCSHSLNMCYRYKHTHTKNCLAQTSTSGTRNSNY